MPDESARRGGLLGMVEPWSVREEGELLKTRIFSVHERYCASPASPDKAGTYVYLRAPDWVNVVALTDDEQVVLIEQFRHGIRQVTLEVPGGMVDPGETPLEAALRELSEETGYGGGEAQLIGWVTPNPAFIDNRCHTALVRGVRPVGPPHLDGNEEIGVRLAPLTDVPELVRSGAIHHALVVAAFHHLSIWREG